MADRAVVGVYRNEEEAMKAINDLVEMGYHKDDISVLAQDRDQLDRIKDDSDLSTESTKNVGAGAATGAAAGGVIGGVGALIAELGILTIPGVGPFLAAGPIVATIGGLAAGGAAGGVVGALVGLGVQKEEAKQYEENLDNGDILVIVKSDDDNYDRTSTTLGTADRNDRGMR